MGDLGQRRQHSGPDRGRPPNEEIPRDCFFDTFYLESGYLRPEIFIEAAETVSRILGSRNMSQSSIRSLFNMLKAMERRIKVEGDRLHADQVRETYNRFLRHCEYQNNRRVIPREFLDFVRRHQRTATRDKKEFCGFVEYLTSIMARMKTK